jgi:hypothetical protein
MLSVVSLFKKTETPAEEIAKPYLLFINPGSLDMNLVKLMGVSVKESNDPIGFFGTGLKYAMATALRLGGAMTIYANGERFEIRGRKVTLRDKEFTQVMLNDEALGFTTELGKQWEAWMVVRELYSNALDENGEAMIQSGDIAEAALDGNSAIVLEGDCFVSVWENRQNYFLSQHEACVHTTQHVNSFDALGHNHAVFYRGIKVFDTSLPTLYRYNILDTVTLTEDRTLRYEFQLKEAVEKAIITSKDANYLTRSLTSGEYTFEHYLSFSDGHSGVQMSDEFKAVCRKLADRKPRDLNTGAIRWYQTRIKTFAPIIPATLTRVQQAQMDKAVAFVKRLGFDGLEEYPITVVNWLGENIYGHAKDDRILISRECFDKGTKFLASTLLEEFVHLRYNLTDETRALQNWLFSKISGPVLDRIDLYVEVLEDLQGRRPQSPPHEIVHNVRTLCEPAAAISIARLA